MIQKLILFLVIIFYVPQAWAATYYMSPSGDNGNIGTSSETPWKTFAYAFGEMVAEDELVLLDGTYSIAAGTGCINFNNALSGQVPSGTSKALPTIVRAQNEGSVFVDGTGDYGNFGLFVGRSTRKDSYIKIQGITFIGGGQLYNTSYDYIKNCGFDGGLFIGTSDHENGNDYNLIEDCWGWATDKRIASQNYKSNYTVWRRYVLRSDGTDCGSQTGPEVGFTVYNSKEVSVQNMIIVDRENINDDTCYGYGDFATAQHLDDSDYYLYNDEWLGCISINSEDTAYQFECDYGTSPSHTIKNSVALGQTGSAYSFNLGNAVGPVLENLTVVRNGADGSQFYLGSSSSPDCDKLLGTGSSLRAIDSAGTVPYAAIYGPYSIEELKYTTVTNKITTNALDDGTPDSLTYPIRIETGSALEGGNYGATVLYKYGIDGTFHDDADYNTLTANSLWPWPNENRIKSEMAADSARGFCDTGNQLDGVSTITLTSYIWEYLGNQMPGDIYVDSTPPIPSYFAVNATVVSMVASETVTIAGVTNEMTLTCDVSGAQTMTYVSGSGTANSVWSVPSGIANGEVCTTAFAGGTDLIQDDAGNDMALFSGESVTVTTPASPAEAQIPAKAMVMGGGTQQVNLGSGTGGLYLGN